MTIQVGLFHRSRRPHMAHVASQDVQERMRAESAVERIEMSPYPEVRALNCCCSYVSNVARGYIPSRRQVQQSSVKSLVHEEEMREYGQIQKKERLRQNGNFHVYL